MDNWKRLRPLLEKHFNLEELEELAFNVDVEWEDIPGKTKQEKSRKLLQHLQRRKCIPLLIETLQEARPNINWLEGTPDDLPNPYLGLHAFRLEDEHLFFGREAMTNRLLKATETQTFLAVVGPSGSGKSSLVMAGLLPRLMQQGTWLVATFRPGPKPFQALLRALLRLLHPDNVAQQTAELNQWLDYLHQKTVTLHQLIEQILDRHEPDTKVLIVADQFEELYTLCQDTSLRHNFLDQLLAAQADESHLARPTHLLTLSLRSDFLGQVQNDHLPFVEAVRSGLELIMPMSRAELRQAIKYPALNAGVEFDPTLIDRILDDVAQEPGQLPLLEFALSLLWHKREDARIHHQTYEAIGRVSGALAQYADEQYQKLPQAEQEQARFIFLKLVQPGEGTEDTKRLALKSEVGTERWPLVTKLADARLIVTDQNDASEETVEVIHEALIWGWQQLQDWVNDDRQFLTWYKQLRRAYQQWQESEQDNGDLLRGTLLKQTRRWVEDRAIQLEDGEKEFIQISLEVNSRDERNLLENKIYRGSIKDLRQAGLHDLNLSNIKLSRTDLTDLNLGGADLRKADLNRTVLIEVDLSGANLSGANLDWANLRGANLGGANLRGASLGGAELSGADLSGANLNRTELRMSRINDATKLDDKWLLVWKIVNREIDKSKLSGVDLSGANLSGADLSRVDLSEARLRGAFLRNVNLRGADLSGVDLSGVDFKGARIDKATKIDDKWLLVWKIINSPISDANLSETDLSGANLSGAFLNDPNLSGADLSGADLSGVDLSGADLSETDLRETDLSEARYNTSTKWPGNFDPKEAGAILID